MAPHLAHLLREAGQDVPARKPTLEVNPQHALLRRLQGEADEARATDLAHLLLDQAELAAGAPLPAPAAFVQRMNGMLASWGQPAQRTLRPAPRRPEPFSGLVHARGVVVAHVLVDVGVEAFPRLG